MKTCWWPGNMSQFIKLYPKKIFRFDRIHQSFPIPQNISHMSFRKKDLKKWKPHCNEEKTPRHPQNEGKTANSTYTHSERERREFNTHSAIHMCDLRENLHVYRAASEIFNYICNGDFVLLEVGFGLWRRIKTSKTAHENTKMNFSFFIFNSHSTAWMKKKVKYEEKVFDPFVSYNKDEQWIQHHIWRWENLRKKSDYASNCFVSFKLCFSL